ncbi:MAG: ATP-binding cassette domain-containing protein [Planctomycetota bacterium]
MAAAVEVLNVTKTYDDLIAVNHVSLSVPRGATLGLIGPNGAGKTSLLRIMSTLSQADEGDVLIEGCSVHKEPGRVRRKLGFMPAEFGCPRNVTIEEYLDFFACMYDLTDGERRQRVRDVCELTDLAGREDVLVKGLSTGNKQRLLLAKTLLHDPTVLILDEPASGLDPRARNELRAIIRTLASLDKAIIISSHILPDIEDISDCIGILEAGHLVVQGDLATLQTQHQTPQRTVRIKVPCEVALRACELLRALPKVTACEIRDQQIIVSSDESSKNFLLAALLRADIRILQFSENELNLEDIFMRSTAGRVT